MTRSHEARIGTADGTLTLEVCDFCAGVLDGSAEILNRKNGNTEDE